MTKVCVTCDQLKSKSEFYQKIKGKTKKNGEPLLRSSCISCIKKANAKRQSETKPWKIKNRDKLKQYEWRRQSKKENPERFQEYSRKSYQKSKLKKVERFSGNLSTHKQVAQVHGCCFKKQHLSKSNKINSQVDYNKVDYNKANYNKTNYNEVNYDTTDKRMSI